ncbi:MAG: M3 family oligoendopeptidase [Anaerolineae bacterium]|nr:M3 family oligoendopeptidase [Anaerolineae bacterium]
MEPERWDLSDLLPDAGTPAIEETLAEVEGRLAIFETYRGALSPDLPEATFEEILRSYETLYADVSKLAAYSYLWFSEDTADQAALAFRARANQFAANLENRTLFFTLWWRQLDEAMADRLLAVSGDARYYLESLRRFKPYTLTEPEERIINVKDVNGINSVLTIYDMITMGLAFHLVVDGEERVMTRGELMSYVSDPSPDLRAAAYQELYRVYDGEKDVLSEIYAARVRDWSEEQLKIRGFSSPISVRNLSNDLPDAVVEILLSVIRENVGLFQDFFRLKAEILGLEQLRRYDLYAPLSESEKTYAFADAVRIVDESYRAFSPELADRAMRVLEERHLDAQIRPRKMSGAYCYGVLPTMTPWVLANYTGKIRDVSTLAHELGHAVHAMMAEDHSVLTFHSALPMAETASVFGEMLLTDKLLAEEQDTSVRRTLLGTFLDDAYATIIRQGYFVLFEITAHDMILANATPNDLHARYLENLREQFGDAVRVSDDFALEWTAIPHIYHTPFYCYAYAFGNLLVLALYRKYKEIGAAFEPDYRRILAYGGSASPDHIIREAGFDMTSADFWQSGFDLLAEMLEELKKLV